MWIVAGLLMGVVALAFLAGFHSGPHAHVVAAVAGILVAAWFVFMIAGGRSSSVLWVLLGADTAVSAGLGITSWRAIRHPSATDKHFNSIESELGVAATDLVPKGIVRVRGEQWTAISVNGTVRAGTRVQVLKGDGVLLEVWGEETADDQSEGTGGADRAASEEVDR